MIIVLNILAIMALVFWGYYYTKTSELHNFYWAGLGIKILAGISLGLIYSLHYQGGDTWSMFHEAIKLKDIAFSSINNFTDIYLKSDYTGVPNFSYSIQPRAAFMSKIIAPFAFITGGNYWLVSCYLSLFSFAGFWLLANTVYILFKNKWVAVIPTLFFPSIVFWSSGVLKESIAIGSLAILFSTLTNIYFRKRLSWTEVFLVTISLLLLMHLKYYYAAVLIVAFLTLFLSYYLLPKRSPWYLELGFVLALFALILSVASLTHPNFWPSRFLNVIVDNYYQYEQKSTQGNMVTFENLSPTIFSLLVHSPKALFAGLFFPLWTSTLNFFKLLAVIENWLLLLAFVYSLRSFSLPSDREKRLLLFTMVVFILIMAIFITFSTPNIGTIIRYRIGYLMIFVIIIGANISSRIKAA